MKKITAIIFIILALSLFVTVSGNDKVEIPENPMPYSNVDTLVEYLNNSDLDLEFYCFDKMTNYYDEFISLFVDETAYIGGIADNGEEVMAVTVSFKNDKIVDFSATVNVYNGDKFENYQNDIKDLLNVYANQFDIDTETYVNNFFEFDKYETNVYGNPEYCFEVNDIVGLGVTFDEGKDIMFDGVSYYFTTSVEGMVNVYERGFFQ